MVSSRTKRQSNRRLLRQLNDLDRDIIIGNASDRQKNVVINEGTNDQDFTANDCSGNLTTKENLVIVKTLERCFNKKIDRQMGKIVDTFEDKIQNSVVTTEIDSIITP